jgi:hypothetical protein
MNNRNLSPILKAGLARLSAGAKIVDAPRVEGSPEPLPMQGVAAVAAGSASERRALIAELLLQAAPELAREIDTLRDLLQRMLDVAENCDETGYADGVGFVDIDKLHDEVRAILAPNNKT